MTPSEKEKLIITSKFIELALLGLGASYAAAKGQTANTWVFVGIYLVLFVLTLIEIKAAKFKLHNINLLVKHFYEQNNFTPSKEVKITIHKKINEKYYDQYIDYYPSGTRRGRRHEIKKGLVRYAFTNANGEFTENFTTKEEKLIKLVDKYNFRREEAEEQVKDGEMSYYCSPIMDDDKIWGVLYMKSKCSGTFPDQGAISNSAISKAANVLKRLIEDEIA